MNRNMETGRQKASGVLFVGTALVRAVAGCLVLSLAACGAPVSEKAPSAREGNTAGAGASAGAAPRASESGNTTGSSNQNDRKAISVGQAASDTDERDNRSIPGVPDTIVKDLGSVDARDRYRALDHWETKDGKVSLDPVFEAMEDEDEAVRAKATAIVEQRWAEEQKKEQG